METTEKKPWWLQRWVCKPFDWCERKFFEEHATACYISSGYHVYLAFITSIVGVCAVALLSMFLSRETGQTVGNWILGLVIAFCILNSAMHLYQTRSVFTSTKVMVLRSVFVMCATFLAIMLGLWLGNIVFFLAVILLVLSVIGLFAGGGSKKSGSNDTFILDDGTIVKKEKGLLGEVTWRGSDGHTYERDGNNFHRI